MPFLSRARRSRFLRRKFRVMRTKRLTKSAKRVGTLRRRFLSKRRRMIRRRRRVAGPRIMNTAKGLWAKKRVQLMKMPFRYSSVVTWGSTNGTYMKFINSMYAPVSYPGLVTDQPWGRDTVVGYWNEYRVVGMKYHVEVCFLDEGTTGTSDVVVMTEPYNYQDETYPGIADRTAITNAEYRRIYEQTRPGRKIKYVSPRSAMNGPFRSTCHLRGYISCRKLTPSHEWDAAWTVATASPDVDETIALYLQMFTRDLAYTGSGEDKRMQVFVKLHYIVQWRTPKLTVVS